MSHINSLSLADYVLAFAANKGELLTNKKLQKLLYYTQAWSLALFDDPIFDEEPQAWRHGPVYPNVYHTFKGAGYGPIPFDPVFESYGLTRSADKEQSSRELVDRIEKEHHFAPNNLSLVKEIMEKYGRLSAFSLEIMSHREKPWLDKRAGLSEFDRGDAKISFHSMKEYYRSLLVPVPASA